MEQETISELVTLDQIPTGKKCKVVKFDKETPANKKRHLLDMGITKGTTVYIKMKAPFGDPINIVIRGYELSLRKKDMAYIKVEVI